MSTKKLLRAYDESKPESGRSDFLTVLLDGQNPVLFGLKSRRICQSGTIVFIGREIIANDIFARLVESGRKIPNVKQTLETIEAYVQQLGNFKVGNVVTVAPKSESPGFELVKLADILELPEPHKIYK